MADYRRWKVAGGTFFFTVVACNRAPIFHSRTSRSILGDVIRQCQQKWPFEINAVVLLPEHLHAIWTLPGGDAAYSQRWAWIKKEFTKGWLDSGGEEQPISEERRERGERGVWQPRFWEHTIEDEDDFDRNFDYVHYNPVKHGLVSRPYDWEPSSFRRWVKEGVYERDWGRVDRGILSFSSLDETAMELGSP